nr:hypothetical protein [Sicyoidochytrium minutum DNA virus]
MSQLDRSARMIDGIQAILPGLPALLLRAREIAVKKGSDTADETLHNLKNIVIVLARQPLGTLRDRVKSYEEQEGEKVQITNPTIARIIRESAHEVAAVNRVSAEARKTLEDFEKLRRQLKEAKVDVMNQFRGVMTEFEEMVGITEGDKDYYEEEADEEEEEEEEESSYVESESEGSTSTSSSSASSTSSDSDSNSDSESESSVPVRRGRSSDSPPLSQLCDIIKEVVNSEMAALRQDLKDAGVFRSSNAKPVVSESFQDIFNGGQNDRNDPNSESSMRIAADMGQEAYDRATSNLAVRAADFVLENPGTTTFDLASILAAAQENGLDVQVIMEESTPHPSTPEQSTEPATPPPDVEADNQVRDVARDDDGVQAQENNDQVENE